MKKLIALIKMNFIQCFEYRGDLLIYSLSYAAQPVIYLLVWLAVSASSQSLPMTAQEFAQYYIWLLIVQLWVSAWSSPFIAGDIRHGKLSPYLLKPFAYINFHISENLGEKGLKTLLTVPLVVVLILILKPSWTDLSVFGWVIFFWTWGLAGAIYFLIDMCVGCLAFWFDDISAIDDLYNVLHIIFSGILIPMILMPDFVRNLATFMPFRYSLSFPMEILLGKLSLSEQSLGLFLQIIFVVLIYFIYHKLWVIGVKRYSAFGN